MFPWIFRTKEQTQKSCRNPFSKNFVRIARYGVRINEVSQQNTQHYMVMIQIFIKIHGYYKVMTKDLSVTNKG